MENVDKSLKKKTKNKKILRASGTPIVNESENIQEIKKLVHTLQVYQIELEHQNQELRITEEELELSRNKYVNFFDFSPTPYFVLDLHGIITEVNLCAAKMVGNDRSKVIGRRLDMYIGKEDKNVFSEFIKTVSNSLIKQSCKLTIVNKSKRIFYVQLEGLRIEGLADLNQRCQIAVIDVTEYKKLEASFAKISEELALLKNESRVNS